MVIGSCVELLESQIGDLHYPDEENTDLCRIARQVAELLVSEGCDSKEAVVAATLGDLPYSQDNWKAKVDTQFGKKAGSAWHELAMVREHSHLKDCIQEDCDCDSDKDKGCEHAHKEGCMEGHCVMKRLKEKAPHMGGAARAALMAWISVMVSRVAGRNPPKGWTRQQKADYLAKMEAVAHAVVEKGKKSDLDPVIKKLAAKIKHTVKSF